MSAKHLCTFMGIQTQEFNQNLHITKPVGPNAQVQGTSFAEQVNPSTVLHDEDQEIIHRLQAYISCTLPMRTLQAQLLLK